MVYKEVTSGERHIVNLTAEAMLCYSAAVEQAEDKSWDVKVAEQLEVVRIAIECLDAAIDHKRIQMHKAQQSTVAHDHESKGNK